jgi:hypothetical protein
VQLLPLFGAEVGEELILERIDGMITRREALDPPLRDLHDVPAAIGGVAPAKDQAISLERIEGADQVAGIDVQALPERLLADRAEGTELDQDRRVWRLQPGYRKMLVEPARRDTTQPGE